MSNYFRITVYHPEKNVSAIFDSNGYFEKLWQFSSMLVQKGFKIIAVSDDKSFTCGTLAKVDEDTEHILLRACDIGRPTISKSFIDVRGQVYQPQLRD